MYFERQFQLVLLSAISLVTTIPVASSATLDPQPVKEFETYCYGTEANYSRIAEIVKARKLRRLPKELESLAAPVDGEGESYAVTVNKPLKQVIALGVGHANTCSIYAQGYDLSAILKNIHINYHLKLAFRDDTGPQVYEIHIPSGIKGTVEESWSKGAIAILYMKDRRAITVSFTSPDTAKLLFPAK